MTIIRSFSFKIYKICRIDQNDLIGELLNNSFNLDSKYKRFKTSLLQYFPFVFFEQTFKKILKNIFIIGLNDECSD